MSWRKCLSSIWGPKEQTLSSPVTRSNRRRLLGLSDRQREAFMRKLAFVLIVLGVMGAHASISEAQELKEGIWSGTRTENNAAPEEITVEIKRVSDRGGLVLTGAIFGAGGNGLGIRDIRLDGDKLTYVATQNNGVQQQCSL